MRFVISTIGIAMLASGCQLLGFKTGDENDNHRKIWASHQDGTYSYTLVRGCFCIPSGELRVKVIDYEVVEAVQTNTETPLDSTMLDYVETIESMFNLIDQARDQHADHLTVEYARMGYPKLVSIDWIEHAADDELYLAVSDVEIGSEN